MEQLVIQSSSTNDATKDDMPIEGDTLPSIDEEGGSSPPIDVDGYDSGQDELMDEDEDVDSNFHLDSRKAQERQERKTLLNRKEQKGVQLMRIAVYAVVVLTAVLVSTGVYKIAQKQEATNFQQAFGVNARKLTQAFLGSVDRKIIAVGGLSTTITNYALTHNLTFPNVTIDGWESLSVQTRIQAGGMKVEWSPLVTDENRLGWEEYAITHKQWREDSYAKEQTYKERQDAYFGFESKQVHIMGGAPVEGEPGGRALQTQENGTSGDAPSDNGEEPPKGPTPRPYNREIFLPDRRPGSKGQPPAAARPNGSGPYAPRWQMSPVLPHEFLMNMDLMGIPDYKDSLKSVLKNHQAAMGKANAVADPNNLTEFDFRLIGINRDFLQRGQYRHEQGFYSGDPTTIMAYPVFDVFGPNRIVAGFLTMPLLWRLNLEKVLPDEIYGIQAVLKNNLGQSFTYAIDGPKVTYLGLQDLHDNKYDDMYVSENMADAIKLNHGPDSVTFDSVELDTDFGRYYLYVYPSQTMEDQYTTNEPAIYATIVASIFLFTLLVLVTFDFLVTQRQNVIMKKAVESTALVSTLYPEQMKKRLFKDGGQQEQANDNKGKAWRASTNAVNPPTTEFRAIAERYPASSVLLMDLAGFTCWAAAREPEAVFVLLESLYQKFDRIATSRGVYKIETIGDCWVGVTGVPDAQDDHAPRMAKFASSCQAKMALLVANVLTDKLGADTAELALRVGIDSGPITGGILRGDRGRFQLFGDTINTASRMESNGLPGKIHVSQAFADEMIRHGHESWLVEREDKIHAKGKGLMTTYWVNVVSTKSTASVASSSAPSIGFAESVK